MKTITPAQFDEIRAKDPELELIDVRTPAEFREVHIEGARNVPLDKFDAKKILESRNGSSGQPIYVICNTGNRSSKACRQLIDQGCEQVVNVEGGTKAFVEAGMNVVLGKKTIALDRQVRIAAGALIVIGALLAFVNPFFALFSAFVGAGLVYSGITDSCAMGMMLSKMPWNQVKEKKCDAEPVRDKNSCCSG